MLPRQMPVPFSWNKVMAQKSDYGWSTYPPERTTYPPSEVWV